MKQIAKLLLVCLMVLAAGCGSRSTPTAPDDDIPSLDSLLALDQRVREAIANGQTETEWYGGRVLIMETIRP